MVYIYNINPTIITFGAVEIRWYGLVYVIGFLLAYYALVNARKKQALKLTRTDIDNYLLLLMVGVIVGARLFHIFFNGFLYYLANPVAMLMVWRGGMSFHGGLLGAIIISYFWCKKKHVSPMKLADIITIPMAIALFLGRLANFVNGELWGNRTGVPWCVIFPDVDGCRHPVQIYNAIKRLIALIIIATIQKYGKYKEGYLFWMYLLIVSVGRIITDFFRSDPEFIGLSAGQWGSVLLVIICGAVLVKYYRRDE